jgi:hypothetical protein
VTTKVVQRAEHLAVELDKLARGNEKTACATNNFLAKTDFGSAGGKPYGELPGQELAKSVD